MARGDAGTVKVTTAGTAVQITTSIPADPIKVRAGDIILALEITPHEANSGALMYVGNSGVSSTAGVRIKKGFSKTINFEPGGDRFNTWYIDADNGGDSADWVVLIG
jgi:hypothetical protein